VDIITLPHGLPLTDRVQEITIMALDLTALEAEITDLEAGVPSAVALMNALFTEFEANKNAPAKIQALVDRGRAQVNALAAAVVADTPAVTPPPPTP
jgi:hypothetical protein